MGCPWAIHGLPMGSWAAHGMAHGQPMNNDPMGIPWTAHGTAHGQPMNTLRQVWIFKKLWAHHRRLFIILSLYALTKNIFETLVEERSKNKGISIAAIAKKHACVGSTSKFDRYKVSGVFYGVSASSFKAYADHKGFTKIGDAFTSEIKKETKEKIE